MTTRSEQDCQTEFRAARTQARRRQSRCGGPARSVFLALALALAVGLAALPPSASPAAFIAPNVAVDGPARASDVGADPASQLSTTILALDDPAGVLPSDAPGWIYLVSYPGDIAQGDTLDVDQIATNGYLHLAVSPVGGQLHAVTAPEVEAEPAIVSRVRAGPTAADAD